MDFRVKKDWISWESPKLTPGDVRALTAMTDSVLQHDHPEPHRRALLAIRSRLAGEGIVPDIPMALVPWLSALKSGDKEEIVEIGGILLEAVYLSGDPGADALQGAMTSFATALQNERSARVNGEGNKDPVSAVDWIDPDPEMFYALDSASGVALSGVATDLRDVGRFMRRGARPPSRMLFDGPPGCGKTAGARWLAGQLGKPLAIIMLSSLISKYIGQTGAQFADSVKEAQDRDAILLVDELDAIGGHREKAGEGGAGTHAMQVVSVINQTLDKSPEGFVIIGATNVPKLIDPAVASRFRKRIEFGHPNKATRERMVQQYWRLAPHDHDAFDAMVMRTEGRSGRAVEVAAHEANMIATRRSEDASITIADVIAAIGGLAKESTIGEERGSGLVMV